MITIVTQNKAVVDVDYVAYHACGGSMDGVYRIQGTRPGMTEMVLLGDYTQEQNMLRVLDGIRKNWGNGGMYVMPRDGHVPVD